MIDRQKIIAILEKYEQLDFGWWAVGNNNYGSVAYEILKLIENESPCDCVIDSNKVVDACGAHLGWLVESIEKREC